MTYFESAAKDSSWDELGWDNAPLSVLARVPKGCLQAIRQAGAYIRTVGPKGNKGHYAPPWAVMICESCKRYKSPTVSRYALYRALVSAQEDAEQRSVFLAAYAAGGGTAVVDMIEPSEDRSRRKAMEIRSQKLTIAKKRVKEWSRKAKLADTKLTYWTRRLRSLERSVAKDEASVVHVAASSTSSDPVFVISGPLDPEGERLFWSNDDGWVDRDSATKFTKSERSHFSLPASVTQDEPSCWVEVTWQSR